MWVKLSNSGNFLNFVIPNYNRKFISGQINYLDKVTSYKLSENEIEYRGSKSVLYNTVKEQWLDGNYFRNNLKLRCNLMAFERNYQIKYPSKQLINYRIFSTKIIKPKLNPWFIIGFTEAESSFIIRIS